MFFLIVASVFIILAAIFYYLYYLEKKSKSYDTEGFTLCLAVFSIIGAIVVFIIGLIYNLGSYANQIYAFENLKMIKANEQIYTEKANVLTKQFASYLVEFYPDLEKSIFEKISPEQVDIYLVKYPDLKSSQTIMLLVEQISKLQNSRYECKIRFQEELREINYRTRSPWLFFMPKLETAERDWGYPGAVGLSAQAGLAQQSTAAAPATP